MAAVRSRDNANEAFKSIARGSGKGSFSIESEIDVADKSKLTPELFEGVTQVVSVLPADFDDSQSAEMIQAQGTLNIVRNG